MILNGRIRGSYVRRLSIAITSFLVVVLVIGHARDAHAGYCFCEASLAPDEAQFFVKSDFTGACFTAFVGESFDSLNLCGTNCNNNVRSLKVGDDTRVYAFDRRNRSLTDSNVATYEAGPYCASCLYGMGPHAAGTFESLDLIPKGSHRTSFIKLTPDYPSHHIASSFTENAQGITHNSAVWVFSTTT
jgi:hypothetical protein